MFKFLGMLVAGIMTSFYFFPFFFKAFPILNTKNTMAVVGVFLLGVQLSKFRENFLNKEWLQIVGIALLVSLVGFISVTLNNTPDYTYTTYIVSMFVWLSAAFSVLMLMQWVHKEVRISTIISYLVAVCVFQCVMALWIDSSIVLKTFVDAYIEQEQDFLNTEGVNRLYGIGARLDVAGSRFSAVLAMMAFLLMWKKNIKGVLSIYYVTAFIFISIVGNMIARTTTVGMGLAVMYIILMTYKQNGNKETLKWIFWIICLAIPILVVLYNNNAETRRLMRFAFEGFFSLAEKGEWDVSSNERLMKVMVVFPDNLKTWLIGDGYFINPRETDPYFTGKITGGYYMGTDIGYLRFIFYFGVIGLLTFMAFFYKVTHTCIRFFGEYKHLFVMFLAINFIVWLKVATDIFLVFALFLMLEFSNKVCIKNTPYESKL